MANPNVLAGIAGGGGFLQGLEQGQQRRERNELAGYRREDRARQSQLLKAFPAAVGGDQNALALVAQSDPQTFMGLQTHHAKLAEAKRQEQQQRMQQFAGASLYALDMVRKAPPEQQQAIYQQSVQQLQQMDPEAFEQFGGAPPQYDPAFAQAAAPKLLAIALGPEGMAKYATAQDKPPGNLPIEEVGVDGGMFQKAQVAPDGKLTPIGKPYRKAADASVDLRRDLADNKAAKEQEKAGAAKQAAIDKFDYTLNLIDELIRHPGLPAAVGVKGVTGGLMFGQVVPGTDAADFVARLEQIGGRQFLQAFESLKGGGQITQIEGEKATNAIARMQRSQSEEEFKKAAKEFYDVIDLGLKRLREGGGAPAEATPAGDGQSASGGWSIRVKKEK